MEANNRNCICETCEFRHIVFSYLDEAGILELCNNKSEQSFRKGDVINQEGEKITSFKYLKSGLVKLFRSTPSGEEQVISITRPFEFVSNMSIFSGEKYRYSVTALEDSVVCVVRLDILSRDVVAQVVDVIGLGRSRDRHDAKDGQSRQYR